MAIPRVTENSVNEQGYTGARLRPADFGTGREIASGLESIGRGLGQAAQAVDKIDETYDTAAVKQADAEDLKEIMRIRAEALSATGFDAQTAIGSAREKMEEIKRRRMSSMKDARQQRMYSEVFDARALQIEESFTNHSVKQTVEANRNAAIARGDTYMSMAVDTYGTPEFENNLNTALGELTAINPGAGEDVLNLKRATVKSKVFHDVIAGMLVDEESIQEAGALVEKHAAELLPEHETQLRAKLKPLLEEDEEAVLAGWAFSGDPTPSDDPDAPQTDEDAPYYPADQGGYSGYGGLPKRGAAPISPADPLRGKGRVSNSAQQHRQRGSGNALDIAAPAGTPIYPPMSGKVVRSWLDEKGGWSVMVEHPNGYVTGYAHMRSQSPLKVGDEVEANTVIGSVGSTGKSTGPHVHYTVRQSRAGPKVDPAAIKWATREETGTVDPKKVSWKEGDLVLAAPREDATQTALERLNARAQREGWSQRKYDRVSQRVMALGNRQEGLLRDQQNKVYDDIMGLFAEKGETISSIAQVPGYDKLTGGQQLSVKNMIAGNLKGEEEGEGEGTSTYFQLLEMSYDDPAQFADIPRGKMLEYLGQVKPGERKELYKKYLSIQTDPGGKYEAKLTDASGAANRYLPKDIDPNRRTRFMDRYMAEVERQQGEYKRPLSAQERDALARSLTVEAVRYQGDKANKGYLFEYTPRQGDTRATVNFEEVYSNIPPAVHDQIVRGLRERGQRHSKQDVVRVFLRMGR
jgi:murein DD-endopeptidase MepM/ murein hydrolase activator NlpD